MTEEPQDLQADAQPQQPDGSAAHHEPVRTGSARVDEVIRAVEELEERPLEEHVGVFESAHAQLRRSLDDLDDLDDLGADDDTAGHGGHEPA